MNKGYVYSGLIRLEELKKIINELFKDQNTYYTGYNLESYKISSGLPDEIFESCQVFSEEAELRWERTDNLYRVTLLAVKPVSIKELKLVEGEWLIEDSGSSFYLDKHLRNLVERITYNIYYRNSEATFISLRGFKRETK
ncbi:MAG: hypothetical protein OdinLCB4_007405 [Candidatus Odinarchaeum yellowstonii]|uniref:Uncharacterized protein n=1 Tax=Odinarchaeota yellowstonii (strain LCB_4) TaxID=1841599 RepID=A0AAF0IBE0_ODILC|nr:MAG: hypothetical protein OdinLCB4_007405 [Candidatus Odinarchaeum yellowstonii]